MASRSAPPIHRVPFCSCQHNTELLHHPCPATRRRLFDFNPGRESIFKFINVRDNNDALKVLVDRVDRLNQRLTPLRILCAKALINKDSLQTGPSPVGQQFAQSNPHRKVNPEGFAAAEHLAWILASHPDVTLRSPAEARLLADRLCQLTNRKNPAALDLLATAQAACGDFPTAIKTAGEALSLLGESPAATPVRERLAQFLAGKAWTAPGG